MIYCHHCVVLGPEGLLILAVVREVALNHLSVVADLTILLDTLGVSKLAADLHCCWLDALLLVASVEVILDPVGFGAAAGVVEAIRTLTRILHILSCSICSGFLILV